MAGERMQVSLSRLRHADIEMVRGWRNDPRIVQRMAYRENITPEMQEQWFRSIDNDRNFYFLATVDGRPCGVLNLKNIDRGAGKGETGIFFDPAVELGGIAAFATAMGLTDFAFDTLQLQTLEARILRDNSRAVRHTTALGYLLDAGQGEVENQLYRLGPARYRQATARLRNMVEQYCVIAVAAQ